MKRRNSNRREGRMWACATVVLTGCIGAGAILPGCNGSNDNGGPTIDPPQQFNNVLLPLSNGQTLTLNLRADDNTAKGSVLVQTILAPVLSARRVTFNLPSGTYSVDGKFAPPRSFSVTGTFPDPIGRFAIGGVLPTTAEAGSFRLAVNGQSETGVIPPLVGVTPSASSSPTGTVTPSASPSPTATASLKSTP